MFTEQQDNGNSSSNGNPRILSDCIKSFLIDRKAAGLAKRSVSFYALNLAEFVHYCQTQNIQTVENLTADFLRAYILSLQETHNSGGVHAAFRTLRCFFNWLSFEDIMPATWKNPIRKLHAPKNVLPPLEPVSYDAVNALLDCSNERDAAVFMFLLDSGARASEVCAIDVKDVDFSTGSIIIRHGKGNKQRIIYIGKRVKRALRAYLRTRHDNSPALFATNDGERLTYSGLHEVLRRRQAEAGLKGVTLHGCTSSEHLRQKPAFAKRHFPDPRPLYFHCQRLQILQASCL